MARGSEWHSPPGAVEGEQRRSVAGQTPHVRWVAHQGTWDDSDAVICAGDAALASEDLLAGIYANKYAPRHRSSLGNSMLIPKDFEGLRWISRGSVGL